MRAPVRPLTRPLARLAPSLALGVVACVGGACTAVGRAGRSRSPRDLPPLHAGADSMVSERVAPGVLHHRLWFAAGPQVVHVLDVDRARCWTLSARKAGRGAVGRAGTLALVRGLADSSGREVVGGVNADFFLFAPPGVPVGPHVENGVLVAGPVARPAFALDSAGAPIVGVLRVVGQVVARGDSLTLASWNRTASAGLALFDAAWGARTDSVPGRVLVRVRIVQPLQPLARGALAGVVASIDTGSVAAIGADDVVLAVGPQAPVALRARVRERLTVGDTVRVRRALGPVAPRTAVGGLPVLVRGGAIDPQVDSAGNAGFRGVNPRTAVGVADAGRRLLLVTADGRQPGRSIGMSLRDLATLFRTMGAHDAINLDGGGSTTMVVRGGPTGFRIANTPSDSAGERPVANALAVVADRCAAR